MENERSGQSSDGHLRTMSLGLVVMGVLFTVGAVALRDPALLFLALPILVAPLAAIVALPPADRPLRLTWRSDGSGPEVRIDGTLEGAAPGSIHSLVLEIARPETVREEEPLAYTQGDHRLRFSVVWRAPFPLLESVPVPRASYQDPLGLAERDVPVVGAPLTIDRFPPEANRIGSVPLRRTTALPGEVASRSIGAAGTFFGVRTAVPGDSPRRINWRASARTGHRCVNEFQLDRTGDLLIVLDARPSGLGIDRDRALLSIGRAAAHGIAASFLKEKDRVGLSVFGEYLDAVPLGSGRTHRYRIDALLARAAIAETAGPPERLAVSLRRAYAPGVSTLLISPLADEDSFHLLPHLRRRGFPAVVLSPSPLPLMPAGNPDSAEDRAIVRLTRLVRRARVSRAWEEAPVLDWEEYWTLGGLRGLLRMPGYSGGHR